MEDLTKRFEDLLYKKCLGDKNARQSRYYYRKMFSQTGQIPPGLLLVEENVFEGRKASGRARVFTPVVEAEFVRMVEKASADPEDIEFMTEPLRRVSTFRELLIEKYGEDAVPGVHNFYALARRKKLWRFIKKPDYSEVQNGAYYFKTSDPFDLVQMDGCVFFSFEIRQEDGGWKSPQVIEIFDTGSRYMLAMDMYWSETNVAAVDVFRRWMRLPFPKAKIGFRPDNAEAFRNLERCVKELNRKYSAPGQFYLKPDYARAGKPKDKTHLESSHRALHNFEAMIIDYYKKRGAFAGVRKKVRFKGGRIKEITVTRLDITLDDLRNSGLADRYADRHNHAVHRFSANGVVEKWRPEAVFGEYMRKHGDNVLGFSEKDIEDILKYGYEKVKATVQPSGTIQHQKNIYSVVSGDFLNFTTSTPVKVSEYNGKLFVFDPAADGACIGEAVLTKAYDGEKLEKAERHDKNKVHKNEFEIIVEYLRRNGMSIGDQQRMRLAEMHKSGMTMADVGEVLQANAGKYDAYRMNQKLSAAQVSLVLVNLFFTHAMAHMRARQDEPVRPYAACAN